MPACTCPLGQAALPQREIPRRAFDELTAQAEELGLCDGCGGNVRS